MFESILWIVFTVIAIIVSGIILLQEGKGGGLGEAFGGAGQQTFGVKAQGIAKFTGYMAGALVVIALVISKIRSDDTVFVGLDSTAPTLPISDPTSIPSGSAPDTAPAPATTPATGSEGGDSK